MKKLRTFLLIGWLATPLLLSAQQNYQYAPNSYIFDTEVSQQNDYGGLLIPVRKAYSLWTDHEYFKTSIPDGEATATLIWEDVPGLVGQVEILPGPTAADAKIKVPINKGRGKGNAVIGYAVNGTIYWSWHIWVTDDPSNGVEYTQGIELDRSNKPFTVKQMDRNLGAVSADFLGEDWQKTGGLLYQWGRKDPFPPLVYKDLSFYTIHSYLGDLQHKTISTSTIPIVLRPYTSINENLQYAVKNPLNFIINSDNANWFSNTLWKVDGTTTTYQAWDLWSDNRRGLHSNASSSDINLATDSRSYELKSPFDPCPDGWRVPSHYGRTSQNNNHSPWGRKNSGANDDAIPSNREILPNATNPVLDGIKVYQSLGADFTKAGNGSRNIGRFPTSGQYVYYPNSVAPNTAIFSIFQDESSYGTVWSATFGYDGARPFTLLSDAMRSNTAVGLHGVFINQTNPSKTGNAVRCMRDPNQTLTGIFATEYFAAPKQAYTTGIDLPNTYLITDQTKLEIPVSKPFAVYNQILTSQEMLPADQLVAKVLWTSNPALIQGISLSGSGPSAQINLQLAPGQSGNAVVSLHNGTTDTPAYWSWLIWAPNGDPRLATAKYITEQPIAANGNFVNPTKSTYPPLITTLMDRNVGALDVFQPSTNAEFLEGTKGLLFQWGRKDPIPQFNGVKTGSGNLENISYLGNENASRTGTLTYTPLTEAQYQSTFTQEMTAINDPKLNAMGESYRNIWYSIQHPLTFLYHAGAGAMYDGGTKSNNDLTKVKDWVSTTRNKAANRWGHGGSKSVYDPCPDGWRVPDVSFANLYTSSKGTSPFYNSYKDDGTGKPGVIQDLYYGILDYYQGGIYPAGYTFRSQLYPLGNFPKENIRGELGGSTLTAQRSGIWTAALADLGTGYALGLIFDGKRMASGTAAYPQSAMGVRCTKIESQRFMKEPAAYLNIPLDNPSMITPQLPIRTQ